MSIWKKKPLTQLLSEASESEKGMKRTLTAWSLVALGIGAIIGAATIKTNVKEETPPPQPRMPALP